MNPSFQRLIQGATALLLVFVAAVLGYRLIGGYDWMESIWMVVVTVSTVGYGEKSNLPIELQLLTIAVILFGVSASAYTFGGLVQYLLEGELDRVLGNRKMEREIGKLQGHVVVCGYGRLGEDLVAMLERRGIVYVVVDHDPDRTEVIRQQKGLFVTGDATNDAVLTRANLENARAIVTTLPTDAQNVFIALTARNLCPHLQIIATAEHSSSCRKLRQAGADKIVMPHRVGAQQMERMISRPTTADLFDLFAEASEKEMELDEFLVREQSRLVGTTIADSEIRDRFDLLIIGVKRSDGELLLNPPHSLEIGALDTLMVVGPMSRINEFKNADNRQAG